MSSVEPEICWFEVIYHEIIEKEKLYSLYTATIYSYNEASVEQWTLLVNFVYENNKDMILKF